MLVNLLKRSLVIILLSLFAITGEALAGDDSTAKSADDKTQQSGTQQPVIIEYNLSELVPQATALSVNLASLEKNISDIPDMTSIKKQYTEMALRISDALQKLDALKSEPRRNYDRLLRLRQDLAHEKDVFERQTRPLNVSLQLLDKRDLQWQTEKEYWIDLQSNFLKQRSLDKLGPVFENTERTISVAQNLIRKHIENLVAVQISGGLVKSKIDKLDIKLRALLLSARKVFMHGQASPMYSLVFYSQFNRDLWQTGWEGFGLMGLPDVRFFAQHDIVYTLLILLFLFLSVLIYRNYEQLKEAEYLGFVARRPVAVVFFVSALLAALHHEFWEAPPSIHLMNTIIGGIACVRLLSGVLEQAWKRQAAYGVMLSYILMQVLLSSGLPVPLFRFYTLISAVLGIWFCLKWASESIATEESSSYSVLLRLAALLFIIIVIAEFWGETGIAAYLYISLFKSMAIILPIILFIYMIKSGLNWLYFSSPLWQIKLMRNDAGEFAKKTGFIIEAFIYFFIMLPAILSALKVFDSVPEAISSLLSPGFIVGGEKISIGVIFASLVILYSSFLASHIIPKVMLDEQVSGQKMERGVRNSVGRLLQYFIVFIGFLIVLSLVGLDLTKFTIMLSAFSIGIGFGMQSIVNNFVSGLIMLFERPLREGDSIDINNERATIKKIGLRSTVVKKLDEAEVIIPNADLINAPVTNWTLSNREFRLNMPVSVAYGSNVSLVEEVLMGCAKENNNVINSPTPQVLFVNFGESSLDFEVRAWIKEGDDRMLVKSEIYHEIDRRFRELNIAIPFPQRDLHLRSVDWATQENALELPINGLVSEEKPK